MVGESGITTLGVIWGQYLTSGIAGKLYGTSTPEQTSSFAPAYPKCFLPKGGHRSDGHGANVDYDAEMSDRCCVFWRAYSDFALVLNIITYV